MSLSEVKNRKNRSGQQLHDTIESFSFYLSTSEKKTHEMAVAAPGVDGCRIDSDCETFFVWILLYNAGTDIPTGVLHAYTVRYR